MSSLTSLTSPWAAPLFLRVSRPPPSSLCLRSPQCPASMTTGPSHSHPSSWSALRGWSGGTSSLCCPPHWTPFSLRTTPNTLLMTPSPPHSIWLLSTWKIKLCKNAVHRLIHSTFNTIIPQNRPLPTEDWWLPVEVVKSTKFLGVHLAENLTWSLNTNTKKKKKGKESTAASVLPTKAKDSTYPTPHPHHFLQRDYWEHPEELYHCLVL